MKVKSLSHVRLFATPWTVAHQVPLSVEFSRQEYWSGLPFPSAGDLPEPGIEPLSPALQANLSKPPGAPAANCNISSVQFSSVTQSCPIICDPMNHSTPGLPVHHQLPESTQPMSIESVMPSNCLILCHPLLLLPSIFPSIRVFSNDSVLCVRW